MQLEQELMDVIGKAGFLNIEKKGKKDIVDAMVKKFAKSSGELDKKRLAILKKTLYVHSINGVLRQDGKKVLTCENCKALTNTLIKLEINSKHSCPACVATELGIKAVISGVDLAAPGTESKTVVVVVGEKSTDKSLLNGKKDAKKKASKN